VLFLDELPEFRKEALEGLRQPLEDGTVSIARTSMSVTYPCLFMLVAAMNPCEDAYAGLSSSPVECTDHQRIQYYAKLSRPLLDRIDIQIDVPRVEFREILGSKKSEDSQDIRDRVIRARQRQMERLRESGVLCNAQMRNREVKRFCPVSGTIRELLQAAVDKLGFSARAFHRVLKVARTIADLEGAGELGTAHVSEAIQYRVLDKHF
jgi:magnesium chelatase family protein